MAAPVLSHFEKPVTLSVSRIVIDEYGDGLSEITVVIRIGGILLQSARSDRGGSFEFRNIKLDAAIHSIEAQAPRYSSAKENFSVKPELEGTTINVCLRLESLEVPSESHEVSAEVFEIESGTHAPDIHGTFPNEWRLHMSKNLRFSRVKVFFATDRHEGRIENNDFRKAFTEARAEDNKLRYGQCEVSIPERHRIGELESPSLFKLEFRQNPSKHIALLNGQILEKVSFFSNVSATAQTSRNWDAFVFVHGYSVTFAEALRRTAQIAYDLAFEGAPICYSWPSRGKYSEYPADEASIEWSEAHLMELLNELSSQNGIKTIHLLAHSMGNRALVKCLERIGNAMSQGAASIFRQTILAAPDIDAGVFENIAPLAVKAASRTTLYASSNDLPLQWSKDFHGYRRAGDTEQGIVIVSGVDSIDASKVPSGFLGHSYYGDSRTLLSDIFELFKTGTAPPRFGLRPEQFNGRPYWVFVP
jgi:esterase/lipase superfamily enzyme